MSAFVWLTLLTCLAITLLSPLLVALMLFLVPGRKGNMRTEREVVHDGIAAEAAKSLYRDRLAFDGFLIVDETDPLRLKAMKPKAPEMETHTHGDKGMLVEIDFVPEPRGVRVRVAAWMNDYILFDTGEGRLIDLTLQRIFSAQLEQDPAPVVANCSAMAVSSLVAALLGIATIAIVTINTTAPKLWLAGVVAGATLACPASMLLALEAIKQIRRRPAELTGAGIATGTMILGTLGAISGAVALSMPFGAVFVDWWKQVAT